MRRCLLWLLLSAAAASATPRKVAVYAFESRGERLTALADAAGRGFLRGLNALPEVTAGLVRDAPGSESKHRLWSTSETGRAVAKATGADLVLFGVIIRPSPLSDTLTLSCAAWLTARDQVLLAEPLRLTAPSPTSSMAEFERLIADWAPRLCQRWWAPSGDVAEVRAEQARQIFRLRLAEALPAGSRCQLLLQPAPLLSPQTGDRFASWPSPLGPATLLSGEASSGWFELSGAPTVEAGATVVVAPLGLLDAEAPGPGLIVTSRPRGAVVSLNGVVCGATPLWVPVPLAGSAELQLAHPGALPYRRPLSDEARAAGLLDVTLATAAPTAPPAAEVGVTLRIESQPAGAEVQLDGVPRGLTPLRLEGVKGRPLLTLRREGYKTWEGQVTTTGPLTVKAELQPDFGGLEISSKPVGAELFVDGQRQGVTPLRLTGVPAGRHELRLSLGGKVVVREITTLSGKVDKLEIDLQEARVVTTGGEDHVLPPTTTTTGAGPAPLSPAATTARRSLAIQGLLWQAKTKLGGRTLHLVAARLTQGTVLSVTLSPARSYLTLPTPSGYEVEFPRFGPVERRTWTVDGVPELRGIELGPSADRRGSLVLHLRLMPGVTARVHETSTVQRLRLVLSSGTRPVTP